MDLLSPVLLSVTQAKADYKATVHVCAYVCGLLENYLF